MFGHPLTDHLYSQVSPSNDALGVMVCACMYVRLLPTGLFKALSGLLIMHRTYVSTQASHFKGRSIAASTRGHRMRSMLLCHLDD